MILRINISATNNVELIDALKRVDISVPSRTEGQKSEFRERWSMYRLLASLCKMSMLDFPIRCDHEDKPDFYLLNGAKEIGVEVTDFIHQDYAHAEAISEKHPCSILDSSSFTIGERKSVEEIHDIATRTKLMGPGWEGDDLERQWVRGVLQAVNDKTEKLGKADFKQYPTNELLIYDALQLSGVDMEQAVSQLQTQLNSYWSSGDKTFDTISIERSLEFYRFSHKGITKLSIVNLWKTI